MHNLVLCTQWVLHKYYLNGSDKAIGIVKKKESPSTNRGLSLVLRRDNEERGLADEDFRGQRGSCSPDGSVEFRKHSLCSLHRELARFKC